MINLNYLKVNTDNDVTMITALLEMYKSQIQVQKLGLQKAFDEKNWGELGEVAHKAKNSFQIVGMQDEANNLQQLEILCQKEQDIHLYKDFLDRFIVACDNSVKEIEDGIDLS
ncbi:MAG: hypothetical protein B6I20_00665 [Bacteroidetes bacterium 4572_117]|nr:MAG: hypothetical protein B6I20_00665 [Bacteroidetes bacterium 4572_117]